MDACFSMQNFEPQSFSHNSKQREERLNQRTLGPAKEVGKLVSNNMQDRISALHGSTKLSLKRFPSKVKVIIDDFELKFGYSGPPVKSDRHRKIMAIRVRQDKLYTESRKRRLQ
jgi:hypothetical protein